MRSLAARLELERPLVENVFRHRVEGEDVFAYRIAGTEGVRRALHALDLGDHVGGLRRTIGKGGGVGGGYDKVGE